MISVNDIHWIAGFLEGEGSFYKGEPGRRGRNITIICGQVQKWPLEKLNLIIPGKMRLEKRKLPNNSMWRWYTNVANSAGLMMTIYSLMSPKRQEQIRDALFIWGLRRSKDWKYRTHCINGHEISDANTYFTGKQRCCKLCRKETIRHWHEKQRNKGLLVK